MPCPHKREQPAETVSMSPGGAASVPLDCITIRASINGLAERYGARRGRHPATASTHSILSSHIRGLRHPTPVAPAGMTDADGTDGGRSLFSEGRSVPPCQALLRHALQPVGRDV